MAALIPIWERQDDWKNKKRYMKELLAFFGANAPVARISEANIQEYVGFALKQPVRVRTGGPGEEGSRKRLSAVRKTGARLRSPATMNFHLHVRRQMFGRAAKMRDSDGNRLLADVPSVPILETPKRHARPVPDAVLSRVMTLLPEHSVKAIYLTLYFGFRQSEVFTLQRHHVDFEAGVFGFMQKT